MATSANFRISARGKKFFTLETDIAYNNYAQAAIEVSEFMVSEGIDCFLKSWGSDSTPPILTIDGADFELHLTRHFFFSFTQKISLKRTS